MKKLILLLCLFFLEIVHAGNSVNNGGNIITSEQLSTEEIVDVLSKARLDVLRHFNYITLRNAGLDMSNPEPLNLPIYNQLFQAEPSIFQELQSVRVGIKLDGPCHDEEGNDADGSSIGEDPSSICISVPRLREKLDKDTVWHQSLALVAHEYSHRLGFNENQAVELQKAVLKLIQGVQRRPFEETLMDVSRELDICINATQNSIDMINSGELNNTTLTAVILVKLLGYWGWGTYYGQDPVYRLLEDENTNSFNYRFIGVTAAEYSFILGERTQDEATFVGACTLTAENDFCEKQLRTAFKWHKPDIYNQYFDKFVPAYVDAFNGQEEIYLQAWRENLFGYTEEGTFSNLKTKRIRNLNDVLSHLQHIHDRYVDRKQQIAFWLQFD